MKPVTRKDLIAALDELCIEDDDNVVFMTPAVGCNHFYEPVAYQSGFIVIQAMQDDGKKPV